MRLSDFLEDLGSPVAYFPALCPLLGGVQPTLLFCQLAFLKGKERSPSGEIYKTQEQITAETGLTRNEQTTARRILKSKGLLTERYARLDHRMFYTVHLDVLNALWENRQSQHSRKLESNIREEWKVTFGRSEKQHSSEDPEITTEITTEIKKEKSIAQNGFAREQSKDSMPTHVEDQAPKAEHYSPGFVAFHAIYPQKKGKARAWALWKRQHLEPLAALIVQSVHDHLRYDRQWQEDSKFIPHLDTYVSGHRWEDELDMPKPGTRHHRLAI